MAYDPGAIDGTLAAAVGDEPGLIAELRLAFVDGARHATEALEGARSPDDWQAAAWRIKGLAASFGAVRLMALAVAAAEGDPGNPVAIRQIRRAVERL